VAVFCLVSGSYEETWTTLLVSLQICVMRVLAPCSLLDSSMLSDTLHFSYINAVIPFYYYYLGT
jgi:hypothetical protein